MSGDRERKSLREQWRSPLGVLVIIVIGLIVGALFLCAFVFFWLSTSVDSSGAAVDSGFLRIAILMAHLT